MIEHTSQSVEHTHSNSINPTHSTHAIVVGNGVSLLDYDWSYVNNDTNVITTNRNWRGVPSDYTIMTSPSEFAQATANDRAAILYEVELGSGYVAAQWALRFYEFVWLIGFDGARRGMDMSMGPGDSNRRVFTDKSDKATKRLPNTRYAAEMRSLELEHFGRVKMVITRAEMLALEKITGLKRLN